MFTLKSGLIILNTKSKIKLMIRPPEIKVKEIEEDENTLSKTHQILKLKAIEGLKFDKTSLEVEAGKPIALIISNPDF